MMDGRFYHQADAYCVVDHVYRSLKPWVVDFIIKLHAVLYIVYITA